MVLEPEGIYEDSTIDEERPYTETEWDILVIMLECRNLLAGTDIVPIKKL